MAFFNPYNQMYQQQPQMVQNYMPIEVSGETDAKNYPVAANTTVSLISANRDRLWIKSTNASGVVVDFRTFEMKEIKPEIPQYVTKKDFDELKAMIESLAAGGKQ